MDKVYLRSLFVQEKDFFKKLYKGDGNGTLNFASDKSLDTLVKILHLIADGHIPMRRQDEIQVRSAKKFNALNKFSSKTFFRQITKKAIMDPCALRYLARDHIYPTNVHLNPFQGGDSYLTPGVYGATRGEPTYFVPITKPEFELAKKDNSLSVLTKVKEATSIPSESVSASSQLPQQNSINQVGFGNESDLDIETNIDSDSLKKIPDSVLNAFSNPSMTVNNTVYKPKEKKLITQSGSGNVVKKTNSKKIVNSKIKFI